MTDHEIQINIDGYYKDFYLLFDKMIWKIMPNKLTVNNELKKTPGFKGTYMYAVIINSTYKIPEMHHSTGIHACCFST